MVPLKQGQTVYNTATEKKQIDRQREQETKISIYKPKFDKKSLIWKDDILGINDKKRYVLGVISFFLQTGLILLHVHHIVW